jgi:XapX domain-containing protein
MPRGDRRIASLFEFHSLEIFMKLYLASLAVGLLVGVIYAVLNVRSPAPPVIALVGLLGILIGEQIPPLVKQLIKAESPAVWLRDQVQPHMFGQLPKCNDAVAEARTVTADRIEGPRHG